MTPMRRSRTYQSLLVAFLLLPTLLSSAALGQSNPATNPTAVEVDKLFAQWDKPDSPGCSVAVAKQGKPLYSRGYGMANLEYSIPMSPDTVSETGSVAKQFTSAAIALLAQQGKLSLDDPVRKHLPEVPDFGKPVTIRHLISHLSGLRDQNEFFDLMGLPMGRVVHTNDEILEVVSRQKRLNFEPNTEYLYCNTGYTLIAQIVKRVSGKAFAEFTQEQLFGPLGMTHTKWRDDFTSVVKGRAIAYEPDGKGGFRMNMPFGNVHGAGGLLTTVGDLLIWNENFESGRVGGREFVNQLQTRARLKDGREIDYAFGLTVTEYKGVAEVSHGGATAGYRTFLARFPQQQLSIALLCNASNVNTSRVAHQVAEIFLGGDLRENKPTPITVPTTELESKAGLFRDTETDEATRFFVKDAKLMAGFGKGNELIAIAPNKFQPIDSNVEFSFEPGRTGEPLRVRRVSGKFPASVSVRVEPFNPTPAQLAEFAGNYFSEELDVTHSVTIRDGKLRIRNRSLPETVWNPIYADAFMLGNGTLVRFIRDPAGKVDGLEVFTGRMRHVRFVKK